MGDACTTQKIYMQTSALGRGERSWPEMSMENQWNTNCFIKIPKRMRLPFLFFHVAHRPWETPNWMRDLKKEYENLERRSGRFEKGIWEIGEKRSGKTQNRSEKRLILVEGRVSKMRVRQGERCLPLELAKGLIFIFFFFFPFYRVWWKTKMEYRLLN